MAFALAMVTALVSSGLARAQPGLDLKQQYDALFAQNLRKPSDLDAAFKFAELATQLGDYEAAIGALERMLFFNSNLPRVRLELGILYMRLNSLEMARSYFTTALTAPDVPADVRDRVNSFLLEIDRRAQPNQFSFFAQAGFRYQTNANAAPSSFLVSALGQDAILDRRFRSAHDWNAFGLAGFRWVADLQNQRGDTWETDFYSYYARQFEVHRFDLGFVEMQTGPRFVVAPELFPSLTIRPYVLGNYVSLGENPFLGTAGGGAALGFRLWDVTVEPGVEYRRRSFRRSQDFGTADELTGDLVIFMVTTSGRILPNLGWKSRSIYAVNDTRFGFNSYHQWAQDLYLPWDFEVSLPMCGYDRRWTLTPTIGFAETRYAAPNPIIDPTVRRFDLEWHGGATLDIPITDTVGFGLQAFYLNDRSKLRNFNIRDFIIAGGPTLRF